MKKAIDDVDSTGGAVTPKKAPPPPPGSGAQTAWTRIGRCLSYTVWATGAKGELLQCWAYMGGISETLLLVL